MTRNLRLSRDDKRGLRGPILAVLEATRAAAAAGLTDTQVRATALPVSVSGVATQATLALILAELQTLNALLTARLPATLDGGGIRTKEQP